MPRELRKHALFFRREGGRTIEAVAESIMRQLRRGAPLHPFFVANASGLSMKATRGMLVPAELVGVQLRFDETFTNWRAAVGVIACGYALRKSGLADTPETRCVLATMLETPITDDGELAEAPSAYTLH